MKEFFDDLEETGIDGLVVEVIENSYHQGPHHETCTLTFQGQQPRMLTLEVANHITNSHEAGEVHRCIREWLATEPPYDTIHIRDTSEGIKWERDGFPAGTHGKRIV